MNEDGDDDDYCYHELEVYYDLIVTMVMVLQAEVMAVLLSLFVWKLMQQSSAMLKP